MPRMKRGHLGASDNRSGRWQCWCWCWRWCKVILRFVSASKNSFSMGRCFGPLRPHQHVKSIKGGGSNLFMTNQVRKSGMLRSLVLAFARNPGVMPKRFWSSSPPVILVESAVVVGLEFHEQTFHTVPLVLVQIFPPSILSLRRIALHLISLIRSAGHFFFVSHTLFFTLVSRLSCSCTPVAQRPILPTRYASLPQPRIITSTQMPTPSKQNLRP